MSSSGSASQCPVTLQLVSGWSGHCCCCHSLFSQQQCQTPNYSSTISSSICLALLLPFQFHSSAAMWIVLGIGFQPCALLYPYHGYQIPFVARTQHNSPQSESGATDPSIHPPTLFTRQIAMNKNMSKMWNSAIQNMFPNGFEWLSGRNVEVDIVEVEGGG